MRFLIIFLLGAAAGACALRYYEQRGTAGHSDQIAEWHLSGDEIKADLARTGQVARSKLHAAGGRIADARIVAVIKAKYLLDRDLSSVDIKVEVTDGVVELGGTARSAELIGRAVALALETDGVRSVVSRLVIPVNA